MLLCEKNMLGSMFRIYFYLILNVEVYGKFS